MFAMKRQPSGVSRVFTRLVVMASFVPLLALALLIPLPSPLHLSAPAVPTLARLEAYRQLGWSGSRCVDERSFSYDPRREVPDPAFVKERPEGAVASYRPQQGAAVIGPERVEVFHQDPLAVVWARVRYPDSREEVRPFTVRPYGQGVSLDLPQLDVRLCYKNLHSWYVVNEGLPYSRPQNP
ncbi:MAG TPA: hypothetical protein VLA19_22740 [Herpetosiphonaceae bacterium]|nr:hypothetical protein [Herpetosiphonaceae bacterium]